MILRIWRALGDYRISLYEAREALRDAKAVIGKLRAQVRELGGEPRA